jgi:DNA-binding MarR family transcriptional regulator
MAGGNDVTDDHQDRDAARPADLADMPNLLGYALRRAQHVVLGDFHQCLAADGIRAAHYSVLRALAHAPGLRASQVSTALGIKRTNFVPLFDDLERRELVERRDTPKDRRARGLYLTQAGSALLTELDRKVAAHEARFTGRIGPDGRHTLLSLLNRLADPAFDPG